MTFKAEYDPYASHLPALCILLGRLGPSIRSILEVGAGFYSTPVFRVCASSSPDSEHVILESNEQWAAYVADLFDVFVRPFNVNELPHDIAERHWDLAFIDCAVESSRARHATRLHGKADVIVLHDSNPDWDHAYGYSEIVPLWKYAHHFTDTYPHTLVLTDNDEVTRGYTI